MRDFCVTQNNLIKIENFGFHERVLWQTKFEIFTFLERVLCDTRSNLELTHTV